MAKSGNDSASIIRQRSDADDTQRPAAEQDRPGPVLPKATIRLHTFIAHQLFFGRHQNNGKANYGREQCFTLFAANLNSLWTCALADDPYADACLIDIEKQMERVKEKISTIATSIDGLLNSMEESGIRAESQSSVRPVDVPIVFRAVHAAVAVQLLGSLDRVILKALAARHFGLVTVQDWQRIQQNTVTPMRGLFELARFKASGTERNDFAANNARARAALEKLGQLPMDILQGLRRPTLGPFPSKSLVFKDSAVTDLVDESMLAQSLRALDQKLADQSNHSVTMETATEPFNITEDGAATQTKEAVPAKSPKSKARVGVASE